MIAFNETNVWLIHVHAFFILCDASYPDLARISIA
jgi:hypothetical protein